MIIDTLLADPLGHEVLWDYCLEQGIIMPSMKCVNCSSYNHHSVSANRSRFNFGVLTSHFTSKSGWRAWVRSLGKYSLPTSGDSRYCYSVSSRFGSL